MLVVDDSGVNRRLLIAALTELGHEVHAAENGGAHWSCCGSGAALPATTTSCCST